MTYVISPVATCKYLSICRFVFTTTLTIIHPYFSLTSLTSLTFLFLIDLHTFIHSLSYAYSASDHSITIIKEQQGYGGFYFYVIHNRFLSPTIHSKLCWSESEQVLCSVTPDGVIFGWDVDGTQPTFQVSRHSDLITDFIAVNHMNMFVTCSMDKRIVMWSAHNRRVRAVWAVHNRGVRCLSVSESCFTLISGSFDCDARTFDLNSKENVALLRGHQHPITAVQLMCERSATEREHRALTVDESGQVCNYIMTYSSMHPVINPMIHPLILLTHLLTQSITHSITHSTILSFHYRLHLLVSSMDHLCARTIFRSATGANHASVPYADS